MLEKRPIRVLQFLNGTARSGAEEVALELVRGVTPDKFRSYLVCPEPLLHAFGKDLQAPHISAYAMSIEGLCDWKAALSFVKLLRCEHIDVVHAHMIRAALVALPLARLARVPVVIQTCHGREAWRTSRIKRQFWLDRRLSDLADITLAVSESTRAYLIEEKRLRPDKVEVIRNGRRWECVTLSPERHACLRAEFELAQSDLVLGVFGRLEVQKGHRYLLQAVASICQSAPTTKVLFVGDGSLRQELERETDALRIRNIIRFTGYRSDATELMELCDLIVLPSLYEGMPLVPIEAAMRGKAVVATAVDGTSEVVVDGSTGLLVPPRDSARLAQAIVKLLVDPQERRAIGHRAQQRAKELFSLDRQICETETLYVSLLTKSKSHRGLRTVALPDLARVSERSR